MWSKSFFGLRKTNKLLVFCFAISHSCPSFDQARKIALAFLLSATYSKMPPVRTSRNRKPPPAGFDDIEDTLLEFSNKMKDAENASHDGKKKHEMLWPIFQISHQRSRYIYDLYYEKEAISKQLYEWLLKNNYADANLIAKWKKQGYEKLCCLRCIQTKETNFNATCICRVPKAQLKEDQTIQCVSCGCRGCASSD
ncbi:G10 protein-domain-containing protein [Aspergillus welwitschiae]|uniref:G10 protein-domain-containing protein n=2 Tax=Aspergillus subgen. Circumdati TaxID=2720871 RepID=A0A3F3Q7Y6_9EURO|nr:G10 protein-domain-containing protein [Aspergillus welwitschiae]RDH35311.1 G10 protein-domain-containing protein [Aspergillus welwitschiae]